MRGDDFTVKLNVLGLTGIAMGKDEPLPPKQTKALVAVLRDSKLFGTTATSRRLVQVARNSKSSEKLQHRRYVAVWEPQKKEGGEPVVFDVSLGPDTKAEGKFELVVGLTQQTGKNPIPVGMANLPLAEAASLRGKSGRIVLDLPVLNCEKLTVDPFSAEARRKQFRRTRPTDTVTFGQNEKVAALDGRIYYMDTRRDSAVLRVELEITEKTNDLMLKMTGKNRGEPRVVVLNTQPDAIEASHTASLDPQRLLCIDPTVERVLSHDNEVSLYSDGRNLSQQVDAASQYRVKIVDGTTMDAELLEQMRIANDESITVMDTAIERVFSQSPTADGSVISIPSDTTQSSGQVTFREQSSEEVTLKETVKPRRRRFSLLGKMRKGRKDKEAADRGEEVTPTFGTPQIYPNEQASSKTSTQATPLTAVSVSSAEPEQLSVTKLGGAVSDEEYAEHRDAPPVALVTSKSPSTPLYSQALDTPSRTDPAEASTLPKKSVSPSRTSRLLKVTPKNLLGMLERACVCDTEMEDELSLEDTWNVVSETTLKDDIADLGMVFKDLCRPDIFLGEDAMDDESFGIDRDKLNVELRDRLGTNDDDVNDESRSQATSVADTEEGSYLSSLYPSGDELSGSRRRSLQKQGSSRSAGRDLFKRVMSESEKRLAKQSRSTTKAAPKPATKSPTRTRSMKVAGMDVEPYSDVDVSLRDYLERAKRRSSRAFRPVKRHHSLSIVKEDAPSTAADSFESIPLIADPLTMAKSFVEIITSAITPVPDGSLPKVPSVLDARETISVGDLTATSHELRVDIDEFKRKINMHLEKVREDELRPLSPRSRDAAEWAVAKEIATATTKRR